MTDRMICPNCAEPLKEIGIGGILIDRCISCSGIWLDAGELGQYQAAVSRRGSSNADVVSEKFSVYAIIPIATCPRCEEQTLQAGVVGDLDLSRCIECHGVFVPGSWWKSLNRVTGSAEDETKAPALFIEVVFWAVTAMLSR